MLKQRTELTILSPTSSARAGKSGERVNDDDSADAARSGTLRKLNMSEAMTTVGSVANDVWRWRGNLPEGVNPLPQWEATATHDGRCITFAIIQARKTGRLWNIEMHETAETMR